MQLSTNSTPSITQLEQAWENQKLKIDGMKAANLIEEAAQLSLEFVKSNFSALVKNPQLYVTSVGYVLNQSAAAGTILDPTVISNYRAMLPNLNNDPLMVRSRISLCSYLSLAPKDNSNKALISDDLQAAGIANRSLNDVNDPERSLRSSAARALLLAFAHFVSKYGTDYNVNYAAENQQRVLGQKYPAESLYLLAVFKNALSNTKAAEKLLNRAARKLPRDIMRNSGQVHLLKQRIIEEKIKVTLNQAMRRAGPDKTQQLQKIEQQAFEVLNYLKALDIGSTQGPAYGRHMYNRVLLHLAHCYKLQGNTGLAHSLIENSPLLLAEGKMGRNVQYILGR